jgi:uncharacterized protein (TIGR03118 family)
MEIPMMHWLTRLARPRRLPAPTFRPTVESLEDRHLLAGNVLQTNLVSDLPGVANNFDPNLVNPWGISESPSTPATSTTPFRPGSPFWISDNNSGQSTLYNSTGVPQSLVVSIPAPGDPLNPTGTPTGTVFNLASGSGAFPVTGVSSTNAPITKPAAFLFATEDGTIVGWNPQVNPVGFTNAGHYGIIAVPNPNPDTGAVYKGLTIAVGTNGAAISSTDPNSTALLYASNFRAGTVDVFDPNFSPATLAPGAFTDPKLPAGFAPFNVQVLNGKVYVTYAKQDAAKHDDVAGLGFGVVDVYNLDGTGEQRLITGGALNSPWGLAIAPASFGSLAGSLLVGNFGDGRINIYNASNGTPLGALKDPDGEPIQIPGLWALKTGNDGNGGSSQTVYFTAGLAHETHGLFGSLTPVAAGTPEGNAEAEMVQAELDVVSLDLTATINDIKGGASQATIQQDLQTLNTDTHDLVFAEIGYFIDTHHLFFGSSANGGATLQSVNMLFGQLVDLLEDM